MKVLALELDCPVIATLKAKSIRGRKRGRPPLFKGPSLRCFPTDIAEDADLIIGIFHGFRPYAGCRGGLKNGPLPFQVGILKDRFGQSGGWATLRLDPEYRRIQDPPELSDSKDEGSYE